MPPVCRLCSMPFTIPRIRKFSEPAYAAVDFNGPERRFIPGSRPEDENEPRRELSPWTQQWEEELRNLDFDEDSFERLLGDQDSCGAYGCRHIGIAPDNDPLGHMAGPNCVSNTGYNGYWISYEEMKERWSMVTLRNKPRNWTPSSNDEELSREAADCYIVRPELSSNGSPIYLDSDYPMHPSCFEMFKRMSIQRFGKVDIDGLWFSAKIHMRPGYKASLPSSDLSFVQKNTYENMYSRAGYIWHPGTEYLAADPLNVPGLAELLRIGSEGRTSDVALSCPKKDSEAQDTFSRLPVELRRLIVEGLSREDVANLRIASSNFTELKQSYFHHLIKREMPWLWEIDTLPTKEVNWHGLWYKLSAADGGAYADEKKRVWAHRQYDQLRDHVRMSFDLAEQRGTLGSSEQDWWDAEMEKGKEHIMKQLRALKGMGMWPDTKATELKGLRNRRRIYCAIEETLTQIQAWGMEDEQEY